MMLPSKAILQTQLVRKESYRKVMIKFLLLILKLKIVLRTHRRSYIQLTTNQWNEVSSIPTLLKFKWMSEKTTCCQSKKSYLKQMSSRNEIKMQARGLFLKLLLKNRMLIQT